MIWLRRMKSEITSTQQPELLVLKILAAATLIIIVLDSDSRGGGDNNPLLLYNVFFRTQCILYLLIVFLYGVH